MLPFETSIARKIHAGERITSDEAKNLFTNSNSSHLATLATLAKNIHHPKQINSYLIMGIINYTNICVAACDYCAFYRLPRQDGGYLRSAKQMNEEIESLIKNGADMIGFNGGFNPKLKLADYCELFNGIHSANPELVSYDLTVAELSYISKRNRIKLDECVEELKQAGVRWITGGGAEILTPGFRKRHSPGKETVEEYYQAQAAVLDAGLGSTATMVIGFDESLDERLYHLENLRKFQDQHQDNPLTSFLCWTYKAENNTLGGKEVSTQEYLRWLSICRIYLDNFTHIRASVLTQNQNAVTGLNYGANDFDLPLCDEVTEKAGAKILAPAEILKHAQQQKIQHRRPFGN